MRETSALPAREPLQKRSPTRSAPAAAGAVCLALALAQGVATRPAAAGMPFETHLMLKSVEIVSCEPLTAENVEKVNAAIARGADPQRARRAAERVAAEQAGSVVEVRVMRERTVTFSLVPRREEPKADTGWVDADGGGDGDGATRVYFVPEANVAGCEALPAGSRWSMTQDPRIDCDTAPPVGLCVFDAVALPTMPQMLERYGAPDDIGASPAEGNRAND